MDKWWGWSHTLAVTDTNRCDDFRVKFIGTGDPNPQHKIQSSTDVTECGLFNYQHALKVQLILL